uniref:Uncharacterized protein n=1 Tax=Tetraselmis sp. GSL018 TaxID=582737 RepID=A0A061S5Z0_9CHLO|mmetsp:Transcript_37909/g.90031  ORF Transcript_37909/g.90031 Transcript_37909/m.90031 type:complete len:395 (-) Transcript_37909:368-1552(-)|eukprot:CAMPEP_0177602804 /NCGR_PEP_ID=MMETSP0419_2-20121207/15107_1 /TAXON_ID=582737 /ORGANISM="Tetraselmis sp., Strain GSL018" /LENGTH=394 /DNA_ID=CAMNT_0019096399 /DNA_START=368 /DNA_END=1552 /DNA_ORIENTATION=-
MDISALLAASQEDEDRNPLLREPPGGVPKQGNSSRQQENSRPAGQVSAPGLALAAIQDEDSDEDWFNEYSCELALFGDSATQNSLPDSKKQQQTKQGAQTSEAMSIPEKDTTRDSLELQADTAQAARSNSHFEQDMEEDIEPQDQAKNHSTVTDRHFQPGINTDATSGDDVLPQQQLEHESHEEADIARQRACLAVNEDDEGDGIDNHVAWNEAMETRDEGLEQASHDKTESHPIHSEDIPATSHAPTAADITPQHQAAAQPAEGCTNCHPDAARDMSLGGGEEPACGGISRPGDNSMEISPGKSATLGTIVCGLLMQQPLDDRAETSAAWITSKDHKGKIGLLPSLRGNEVRGRGAFQSLRATESAGNNLLEAQNIVEKQAEEPILQDNGPGK